VSEQIPLIEIEGAVFPEHFPACDMYLVVAFRKGEGFGYWSVRSKDWTTEEAAKNSIRSLAECWRSPHIIHVHIAATKPPR
jgi:hypothetical protein